MKRRDFLQKMRSRRRGDRLEPREPERRRSDWRTLRLELPEGEGATAVQEIPVGTLLQRPDGVRLEAAQRCWVRGYRFWRSEQGAPRAELQFRAAAEAEAPPPGATALAPGDVWEPGRE